MTNKDRLIECASKMLTEFQEFLDRCLSSLGPWLDETIDKGDHLAIGKILSCLKTNAVKISEHSMFPTLEDWVENYKQRHSAMGMVVTYNELGQKTDLPRVLQYELTCVLQEACRNAVKHGKAEMIQILAVFDDDALKVTIADNGTGINMDKLNNKAECGAGISNMLAGLSKLGGTIEFMNRGEEQGAVVIVEVPLNGVESANTLNSLEILGKELHDILCPEIIGVSMLLSNYKNELTENEAELWYEIQCVEQELSDYASRARSLSHELLGQPV